MGGGLAGVGGEAHGRAVSVAGNLQEERRFEEAVLHAELGFLDLILRADRLGTKKAQQGRDEPDAIDYWGHGRGI